MRPLCFLPATEHKPQCSALHKLFNRTGEKHHRRAALWHAERAGQGAGPLFENVPDEHEQTPVPPLRQMTTEERLVADFATTGLTLGPHLIAYHRAELYHAGITPAAELCRIGDGTYARIAGAVIARQRPGTASGFIFLSLEDETGISNAIIHPTLYERHRIAVTRGKFLRRRHAPEPGRCNQCAGLGRSHAAAQRGRSALARLPLSRSRRTQSTDCRIAIRGKCIM